MPGARPTISSRPLESPNDGTGALTQSGLRVRACSRNSTSRGQSGQSRSGSLSGRAGAGSAALARDVLARGVLARAVPARDVPASLGLPRARALVVEIVVIGPRRHGGGALQELRRVMTRLARGGALGRIAAELGLQLDQVGENVGLTAQFVGDHRRLAGDGRDHGNP